MRVNEVLRPDEPQMLDLRLFAGSASTLSGISNAASLPRPFTALVLAVTYDTAIAVSRGGEVPLTSCAFDDSLTATRLAHRETVDNDWQHNTAFIWGL